MKLLTVWQINIYLSSHTLYGRKSEDYSEFHFFISSSFLDDIDRISAQNFTPTDDDILRVRIPTTGIVHEDFQFAHVQLR